MVSSGHLPPSQGVNLSVGEENENNAEREKSKEQRDEEIEYSLKMAEAWIQLCLKPIWTFQSCKPTSFMFSLS